MSALEGKVAVITGGSSGIGQRLRNVTGVELNVDGGLGQVWSIFKSMGGAARGAIN